MTGNTLVSPSAFISRDIVMVLSIIFIAGLVSVMDLVSLDPSGSKGSSC